MIKSKILEESVSQPAHELEFHAVDSMLPSTPLPPEDVKHDLKIGHVLKTFNVSQADFLAMTDGSHFNHQY